jgi:hypothetical protein
MVANSASQIGACVTSPFGNIIDPNPSSDERRASSFFSSAGSSVNANLTAAELHDV